MGQQILKKNQLRTEQTIFDRNYFDMIYCCQIYMTMYMYLVDGLYQIRAKQYLG